MDVAVRRAYQITLPAFEARWQQRTRRRYGVIAMFADFTIASLVLLVPLVPLYIARRRRDKRRMAALVAADREAERRAMESAIDELLRSVPPGSAPPPSTPGERDGVA